MITRERKSVLRRHPRGISASKRKAEERANVEFVTSIGVLYQDMISKRRDEDYKVNQPQMDKLMKIYDLFNELADGAHGEVDPMLLSPREECGGATAYFPLLLISGDEIKRFMEAISACSAFSMDVGRGKVCISCTVPNVFVPINKEEDDLG